VPRIATCQEQNETHAHHIQAFLHDTRTHTLYDTHTHTHTHTPHTYTHTHTHTPLARAVLRKHASGCSGYRVYTYTYTHIHTYIHTYIYTHTRTHTHTHTRAHTHTYKYIYTLSRRTCSLMATRERMLRFVSSGPTVRHSQNWLKRQTFSKSQFPCTFTIHFQKSMPRYIY
jgi:hypothetical protein